MERLIRKLLVANRGEVAVRILAACRESGIRSVAIHSEADAAARHVQLADEAVCVGAAASVHSYLNVEAVLRAARDTGADAVHPGYGFLSEDPAFADACEASGLVFVGPPSAVISRMGSKIEARRLMESAGVPVVPGQTPADQTDAGLLAAIEKVGLPALIKASAGGGGKGMRTLREASRVAAAVQAARREAQAAFGDGTLYVEKLVDGAHHVEVQVFGDIDGRVVHVFERECSVQRRHQKVIEESPSPSITPSLRARLLEAAVLAATTARYRSAGTIEFLVDLQHDAFYFLEMNTRLQVEHPVTELVAGVDLVRAQLQVAAERPLPWRQDELTARGHAIEARVYAEDPANGFLPQAGPLLLYREPRLPGVRIDSGVREGDEISVHYDPLIAKVIAHAETRDAAIARLDAALRDFPILGIATNVAFLRRILEHPRFRAGQIDTAFLDGEGASLAEAPPAGEAPAAVMAAVTEHQRRSASGPHGSAASAGAGLHDPWGRLTGWRS